MDSAATYNWITIAGKRVISVRWFVVLLFVVWPLGALPFVLIEIWNRRPYAYTLLSIFMGLCAMLIAPAGDLYRHTMRYFDYAGMSYAQFLSYKNPDFILYYLTWFFANHNINFEILRFLFAFTAYRSLFAVYRHVVNGNELLRENRGIYFCGFVMIFCAVHFFEMAVGLRYGTAACMCVAGIYGALARKSYWGWVLMAISVLLHFMTIPLVLFALICRLFPVRINRRVVLCLACVFGVLGIAIMESLINALPLDAIFKEALLTYVTGYWGSEYLEQYTSFSSFVLIYMILFPVVPLAIGAVARYKRKTRTMFDDFLMLSIVFLSMAIQLPNIFGRYATPIAALVLTTMLTKNQMLWFKVVFVCFMVSTAGQLWQFRKIAGVSRFEKLVYMPMPMIMCERFEEQWVDENFASDGDLK